MCVFKKKQSRAEFHMWDLNPEVSRCTETRAPRPGSEVRSRRKAHPQGTQGLSLVQPVEVRDTETF